MIDAEISRMKEKKVDMMTPANLILQVVQFPGKVRLEILPIKFANIVLFCFEIMYPSYFWSNLLCLHDAFTCALVK